MSEALLIVAHPGHELRVHGWLEQTRPSVLVLTDGSGRTGKPRLASSAAVLERTRSRQGSIFGAFTDAALYASLITRDTALLLDLRDTLAEAIRRQSPALVVSDAIEGYNPIHDLCHALVRSACARVLPRPCHFEFPLIAPPARGKDTEGAVTIHLDDREFARKLAAFDAYPELAEEVRAAFGGAEVVSAAFGHAPELVAELAALRAGTRRDDFRTECLWPAAAALPGEDWRPFYDRYGRALVEAGRYQRAIVFAEHILPMLAVLFADETS